MSGGRRAGEHRGAAHQHLCAAVARTHSRGRGSWTPRADSAVRGETQKQTTTSKSIGTRAPPQPQARHSLGRRPQLCCTHGVGLQRGPGLSTELGAWGVTHPLSDAALQPHALQRATDHDVGRDFRCSRGHRVSPGSPGEGQGLASPQSKSRGASPVRASLSISQGRCTQSAKDPQALPCHQGCQGFQGPRGAHRLRKPPGRPSGFKKGQPQRACKAVRRCLGKGTLTFL